MPVTYSVKKVISPIFTDFRPLVALFTSLSMLFKRLQMAAWLLL